jgi:drug/metabolite transporter (DMT)-like permease
MVYDLLVIVVLFAWSFARIIQKKILKVPDLGGLEFAKWTIIIGAILVLPLIFFVKLSPINIMLGIFLVSILWIFEQFPKFIAIKKEEVSRLMAFSHFKFFFAIVLTILLLGETATINTILGGILMIVGGTSIGLERNFFKKVKFSNVALLLFLLSMFVSGIAYFWRQFLLQRADPISIIFFSTIFAAILISPTIKKKPNIKNFKLFLFAQFLMVYGFLLLLWILSKQELVFTVPLLAIQPLIILILGRRILKESKQTFLIRFIGIILIILGYIILKGFLI